MATNTTPLNPQVNNNPGQDQGAYSPGASSQPGVSQPQSQGTGFVNLSQYLQANQGNQLGNTVASGLQSDVNKVNEGLGTSQGQFNQAVGDINNQTNQYTGDVSNTLGQFNTNYGNLNQQAQGYYTNPNDNSQYNPQNYANYASQAPTADYAKQQIIDPNAYQTFANIRNDKYSGPQQLNNYNSLASQAQNAQNNAQNTQSAAGRQALLASYVNNPQYNAYQQGLDSIYLAQAQPQLSQAAQSARGLYNKVSGAETTAENQAQQAAQNIANLQGNTRNQLGGLQSGILNTLNSTAQADQTAQQQALAGLTGSNGAFNTLNFTPEQRQQLGLQQGQILYNNPEQSISQQLGSYLTPGATPNQQNVANVANLAGLQALQQLSGNAQPVFDLKQAGGYNPNNPYTFNTPQFQANQNTYKQALQSALNANDPNYVPESGQFRSSTSGIKAPTLAGTQSNIVNRIQQDLNQYLTNVNPAFLPQQSLKGLEQRTGLTLQQLQNLANPNQDPSATFTPAMLSALIKANSNIQNDPNDLHPMVSTQLRDLAQMYQNEITPVTNKYIAGQV